MLKKLINLVKALNSNANPNQIAFAATCGFLLGFMPKNNALWYVLFLLFCFIRINKNTFFLITVLCSLITPFLDPAFHTIGIRVLEFGPLIPAYRILMTVPFMPLTKFNNTIVMGSFLTGVIVYIPVFFLFRVLVVTYRKHLRDKIIQSKLMKAFYKSSLIKKIADISAEVAPWEN